MKQTNTLEMEIIRYLKNVTQKNTRPDPMPLNGMSENHEDAYGSRRSELPGQQVVANIMGYARALQVLQTRCGEQLYLIGN